MPETFIMRYADPRGSLRADDVTARLREYADRSGLRIDWTAPHQAASDAEGIAEVVEYQDPDPGVNGFVRLGYDRRHRLVSVALNLAL